MWLYGLDPLPFRNREKFTKKKKKKLECHCQIYVKFLTHVNFIKIQRVEEERGNYLKLTIELI
jgi:hypothetical protein